MAGVSSAKNGKWVSLYVWEGINLQEKVEYFNEK